LPFVELFEKGFAAELVEDEVTGIEGAEGGAVGGEGEVFFGGGSAFGDEERGSDYKSLRRTGTTSPSHDTDDYVIGF
jgi:hypothetical protein